MGNPLNSHPDAIAFNKFVESLPENFRGTFVNAMVESLNTVAFGPTTESPRFVLKPGYNKDTVELDCAKMVMNHPEVARFLENMRSLKASAAPGATTAGGSASAALASVAFGGIMGPMVKGSNSLMNTTSFTNIIHELSQSKSTSIDVHAPATVAASISHDQVPKKKKRSRKKKGNNKSTNSATVNIPSTPKGVLKPTNFLEAALYFSSITASTVEMALALPPESFFAPPLLFSPPNEGFDIEAWMNKLKKVTAKTLSASKATFDTVLDYEQNRGLQHRTLCLFSVALMQTTNPNIRLGDKPAMSSGISVRSNYVKRTIGLFAISLVDHLPPTLNTDQGFKTLNSRGGTGRNSAAPILLANRNVDLGDLKVPNSTQLTVFWQSLPVAEKLSLIRNEQAVIAKGWISLKKTWCLCKYCRSRTIRLADVYEVLYRCYYEDLDNMADSLDSKSTSTGSSPEFTLLKPKTRKHLYSQLSVLADDIIDERGYHYQMVMKRLGKAFDGDYDWGDCDHSDVACDSCRQRYGKPAQSTTSPTNTASFASSSSSMLKDEYSDDEADVIDEDEEEDDDDDIIDDEELEIFYKDFNLMEDEEIIYAESELPIDPAHLSTSFPHLYDPRLYTMPRPLVLAYNHPSDTEEIADGQQLYESFVSLLFQFHLVPKYLEVEALNRQRRLLEEEEEQERLEKEKREQKILAKQKKKERQKEAKRRQQVDSNNVEANAVIGKVETASEVSEQIDADNVDIAETGVAADIVDDDVVTTDIVDDDDIVTSDIAVDEDESEVDMATSTSTVSEEQAQDSIEYYSESEKEDNIECYSESEKEDGIEEASPIHEYRDGQKEFTDTNFSGPSTDLHDEAPPGFNSQPPIGKSRHSASNPTTKPEELSLSGELPPGISETWFDRILTGSFSNVTAVDDLWNPIFIKAKRSALSIVTDDESSNNCCNWSPFNENSTVYSNTNYF